MLLVIGGIGISEFSTATKNQTARKQQAGRKQKSQTPELVTADLIKIMQHN